MRAHRTARDFFDTYTRDLTTEDLQRLFTRDARDAYRFFARHIDSDALANLPWHRRAFGHARLLFLAFAMKLSPARRAVYGIALIAAIVGAINLFQGIHLLWIGIDLPLINAIGIGVPSFTFTKGTSSLIVAFALMNLLVLLELFDRLTLKNDLEIARDIQQAMLPSGVVSAPGVDIVGLTRPANTVGGDFYDILPFPDGRLAVAVGDVAGKGSPAALLMALLLAIMRTLIDEGLEPGELVTRLNVQVSRHAPPNRFITLFYGVYNPADGELVYVNAGHMPPLVVRTAPGESAAPVEVQRLSDGGIALGMFVGASYTPGRYWIQPDELLAVYSDGVTEAENPAGHPFDESGLIGVLDAHRAHAVADAGAAVLAAVRAHTADNRPTDDVTVLLLRRSNIAAAAGV
jgi:sigma-B regulation protein RsbU (phosphoserine phosphatase)